MPFYNPPILPSTDTPSYLGVASSGSTVLFSRGDHVHPGLNQQQILWTLIGANMNITTDQTFTKNFGFSTYLINSIICTNPSVSLTLAAGGIYTGASKGGVTVVAAGQVYSALVSPANILALTLANTDLRSEANLFLSLTVAQGGASTADFYVTGIPIT